LAEAPKKRSLTASTWLCPLPVVMASCGDIEGDMNIITLAWVGTASSEPATIAIGVRPTRYSWGLIQRYGDFVINLPDASQVEALQYCGTVSGRNEDKFEKTGFTAVRADAVRSPIIAECPVNIECKVKDRISLGSHDLFLGEVVAVHGNADLISEGTIAFTKYAPISYCRGKYYRLGDEIKI
jgi:flavin reductase (DIM6/NTAB) family NADH-FMN oxidoreductase RutF